MLKDCLEMMMSDDFSYLKPDTSSPGSPHHFFFWLKHGETCCGQDFNDKCSSKIIQWSHWANIFEIIIPSVSICISFLDSLISEAGSLLVLVPCFTCQDSLSLFGCTWCSWSCCLCYGPTNVMGLIPQWGITEYHGRPSPCVLRSPQPTATYLFSCGSWAEGVKGPGQHTVKPNQASYHMFCSYSTWIVDWLLCNTNHGYHVICAGSKLSRGSNSIEPAQTAWYPWLV